ncbi:SMI1/KNR4 family protein [Kribbella sp. NPDC056951]|uniref:SMI1/KNR4 family protein n=1 Tax=Kribbella sp. NPDC056951 TaxID=3345978 RepID=UPI00363C1EBE
MTVSTSWSRIVDWLATNHPSTVPHINPPATAVDLRYLQAAMNRPLPADLVEYLQIANGTTHRSIAGSLIPTLYNLIPVMEMLSRRHLEQKTQRGLHGAGPWSGDGDPAGSMSTDWLDNFLPIAEAADAGLLYVDLRDGDQFGCVWEWYPEGGPSGAPWWGGVGEMLEEIASAFVDGGAASRKGRSPELPHVDDGYLRWGNVPA